MHKTMLGDDLLSDNHSDNKIITDIKSLFRVRIQTDQDKVPMSQRMMARLLHVTVPYFIPRQKEAGVCFKF